MINGNECTIWRGKAKTISQRFWEKVDRTGECWLWTRCCFRQGYGLFRIHNNNYLAHRVAWELVNGEIPTGLDVLHSCDNPPCVNPNHLHIGTHSQNMLESVARCRWIPCNGSKNGAAKLNDSDVMKIRELSLAGYSQNQLGRMFGVNGSNINFIVNRHTWRHI